MIFWFIMPYSLVKIHWCFIGTFCLHPQDWKVCCLLLASLTLEPCQWRQCAPPKCRWSSTEAQVIRTCKIMLFACFTVRTSNSTSVIYVLPLRWETILGVHIYQFRLPELWSRLPVIKNHRLLNITQWDVTFPMLLLQCCLDAQRVDFNPVPQV
jgi:hypothetical protein